MKEYYMNLAINESKKAYKKGEMPVGAVIVKKNKVIGRGYNKKEKTKNAIMHAEIIAIQKACKKNKDWRLNDCEMYITMEPCSMCMGAIIESRIKKVYCGIKNKKSQNINDLIVKNEKIEIEYYVLEKQIKEQINYFFKNIRKRKTNICLHNKK